MSNLLYLHTVSLSHAYESLSLVCIVIPQQNGLHLFGTLRTEAQFHGVSISSSDPEA